MAPSEEERARRKEANKLHLSSDQLIAIGTVAVRSAELDMEIEATSAMFAKDLLPLFQELIQKFPTPKKLDFIGEYLTKRLPEKTVEIREFISSAHAARGERDDVIHRYWIETDDPERKDLMALTKWPKFKHKRTVDTKWLLALSDRMAAHVWALYDWHMAAIRREVPSAGSNSLNEILRLQGQPPTGGSDVLRKP